MKGGEKMSKQDIVVNDTVNTGIEEETKFLGGHVPVSLYNEVKAEAAKRGEKLQDAIKHAALLYLDAVKRGELD